MFLGTMVFLFVFGFLFLELMRLKRRVNRIFKGGKARDLEEVFVAQAKLSQNMRRELDELLVESSELRAMAEKGIQYVGLVRFNPFKRTGGDQSFAMALLDSKADGIILLSLHARTETRVYAKPIKQGESLEYKLSREEEEALVKALGVAKSPM